MKISCNSQILGYSPNVNECTACGDKDNLVKFSIKDNGVKCASCTTQDKSAIKISSSTFMALKYISTCPIKSLFGFNLKGDSLKELMLLSKVYFNEKLEKDYKFTF